MSDMPQNTEETQNTEAQPQDKVNETYTQDDLNSAMEKARQQEKDKLYKRISDMDTKSQEYADKLNQTNEMLKSLVEERDKATQELEEKRQEELTVEERVAQRLKALEEKELLMQQQLERVAEEAALRVRASELKLFKANQIAESNLTLTELVSGNTEDEILESIVRAKEREDAIFKRAKEQARAELSNSLPKPAPAPIQQNTDSKLLVDPREKFNLANLSSEDFSRLKAELLAKARQQVS